jgi:hypothetical protein
MGAAGGEVRITWDLARLRLLPKDDTPPPHREKQHVDA